MTLQNYNPTLLTHGEMKQMVDLQKVAIAHLDSEDVLQPLTVDEFTYILNGNGFIVGLFDEGRLIAFRALLAPPLDADHLGLDAGLSGESLMHVIYQELSIVHPDYRGRGLQMQMGEWVMNQIDRSRYDYVCATVAPFNIASLKDKFALGLQIVALKRKYEGKLRYVFMKKLHITQVHRNFTEERLIPMSDIMQQQLLLNEGFVGCEMQYTSEWHVVYRK